MTELLRGWQTRGQKTSLNVNVFILCGVTTATTEKSSKRKPKEVIYFFLMALQKYTWEETLQMSRINFYRIY